MYLWKGFTSHTAKFYNEKTRSFTTKFPENFIVTVNLTFDKLYFCFINIKKILEWVKDWSKDVQLKRTNSNFEKGYKSLKVYSGQVERISHLFNQSQNKLLHMLL